MNQSLPAKKSPTLFEILSVYSAGVTQGIGLVTFPAAAGILTSPDHYGLSSSAYGMLFVPQAAMAIVSSLCGNQVLRLLGGAKRVFLAGIACNALSMLLLLLSQFVIGERHLVYPLLLLATTFMGLAFGLTVPTINTYASQFFPKSVDRALLALNTLLGLGTALAPVIVSLFVGLGIWWGLPLSVLALSVLGLIFTIPLPLVSTTVTQHNRVTTSGVPAVFPLFAAVALLYGICETMNGNWASIFLSGSLKAGPTQASLALTCFWGMVTVGRLFFAATDKWLPGPVVFRSLPAVITLAFLLILLLRQGQDTAGIAIFALAGFGCSAMLPLVISTAQSRMPAISETVAGSMIAFYQIGYGVAAFGVGTLEQYLQLPLHAILGGTSVLGIVLLVLASMATSHKTEGSPLPSAP